MNMVFVGFRKPNASCRALDVHASSRAYQEDRMLHQGRIYRWVAGGGGAVSNMECPIW